jgi:hypothetical protein
MTMTEERTKLEAPVEHNRGVRWGIVAVVCLGVLASGILIGTLVDSGAEDSTDPVSNVLSDEPSAEAVDIAERWGKAWESGDTDAVLALYSPVVEERYIVDQTFRAVWKDVEAAIDQINSVNDFDRFELVRLEEFPTSVVAEYDVQWAPEGDSSPDQSTVVVVFIGPQEGADDADGGLILASDIYVMPWVNLFGVDYDAEWAVIE